jgi:predicted nucleotidyltransferase
MGNTFENEGQLFKTLSVLREQKKNGATRLGIFGSRARGDQKSGSDIDVFAEFNDQPILGLEQEYFGDVNLVSSSSDNQGNGVDLIRRSARWLWKRQK